MGIHFHVPGCKRKELAQEIGTWLGCETKYLGVPSCAYRVGFATVDKDGNFTVDSAADEETVERLIEHLYDAGFESDDGGARKNREFAFPFPKTCSRPQQKKIFVQSQLQNAVFLRQPSE